MVPTARKKKRKFKTMANKVLLAGGIVVGLFLSTFGALYAWWYFQQKPYSYVSPVPAQSVEKLVKKELPDTSSSRELKELLDKNMIKYSAIHAGTAWSYIVTLESGEEILFSAKNKLEAQVSSLQLILSRLTIEDRKFSRLDFRFDKPVIVFK